MSEESKRLNPEALLAAYEAHQKHARDQGRKGSGLEKAICAYLDAYTDRDAELAEAQGAIEHLDRDNQRLRLEANQLRVAVEATQEAVTRALKWKDRAEAAEAKLAKAVEALRRLDEATAISTNSESADRAFSFVHAVAAGALTKIEGETQ